MSDPSQESQSQMEPSINIGVLVPPELKEEPDENDDKDGFFNEEVQIQRSICMDHPALKAMGILDQSTSRSEEEINSKGSVRYENPALVVSTGPETNSTDQAGQSGFANSFIDNAEVEEDSIKIEPIEIESVVDQNVQSYYVIPYADEGNQLSDCSTNNTYKIKLESQRSLGIEGQEKFCPDYSTICGHCNVDFDNDKNLQTHIKLAHDIYAKMIERGKMLYSSKETSAGSSKNFQNPVHQNPVVIDEVKPDSVSLKKKRGRPPKKNKDIQVNLTNNIYSSGKVEKKELTEYEIQSIIESSSNLVVQLGIRCSNASKNIVYNQKPLKTRVFQNRVQKRKTKKYQICFICKKQLLVGFSHLDIHMRVHTREKPFFCKLCRKYFSHISSLKKHQLLHTGEKSYTCTICFKKFYTLYYLNSHKIVHKGDLETLQKFDCTTCAKTFTRKDCLRAHEKNIHLSQGVNKNIKCPMCPKSYRIMFHLETHIRSHTGEKPFKCSICQKSFISRNLVTTHEKIHKGEKKYSCTECEKKYRKSDKLKEHVKKFHRNESGDYKCSTCEKIYSQKWGLTEHIKKSHSNAAKPHICTFCSKSFWTFPNLTLHMRTHTKEKPYKCTLCSKTFPGTSVLNSHKRYNHMAQKPEKRHECPICHKKFERKSYVRRHQSYHTGIKNYKCSNCDKSYFQKSTLTQHMKIQHSSAEGVLKEYECNFCARKFIKNAYLNVHIRSHTGERPYKCAICSKSFSSNGGLTSHNNSHRDKAYKCPDCSNGYSAKQTLKNHIKKVHDK